MRFFKLSYILLVFISFGCSKINLSKEHIVKPKILVSIAPYAYFVEKIVQDTVQVKILAPSNINPHIFDPSYQIAKQIYDVDIWFKIGEVFEEKLQKLANNLEVTTIDLSKNISLLNSRCHHKHIHMHEHAYDRHFWLSPKIVKEQINTILEALLEKYPDKKDFFEKNFKKLKDEISQLDQKLLSMTQSLKNRVLITSHSAFLYFCKDYNFDQIAMEEEGKELSLKDLNIMYDQLLSKKINCVLIQPQYNNKGAKIIADYLSKKRYLINPYEKNYKKTINDLTSILNDNSN